jgi:hypothetical protein
MIAITTAHLCFHVVKTIIFKGQGQSSGACPLKRVRVVVFNVKNISVMLVEESGVLGENHQHVTSY